jgi:hypothetical protein
MLKLLETVEKQNQRKNEGNKETLEQLMLFYVGLIYFS